MTTAIIPQRGPGQDTQRILETARNGVRRGVSPTLLNDFVNFETQGRFTSLEDFQASPQVLDLIAQEERAERLRGGVGLRDVARSVSQGALFGFADELTGLGASIIPGGRTGQEARDEFRRREAEFRLRHPRIAGAAEFGGAIATAFVPGLGGARAVRAARGLARGATRGAVPAGRAVGAGALTGAPPSLAAAGRSAAAARQARVAAGTGRLQRGGLFGASARAAGIGAGFAGVEGAGRAEGGIGARLRGAAASGTVGAVVGAPLPFAGRLIGGLARGVTDVVRPGAAASRLAKEETGAAISDIGFDAARRRLREREIARPGLQTVGDLSPQTQLLLDDAVTGNRQVSEAAEALLGRRQRGQAARIIRDLEEVTGGPPQVRRAIADHESELSRLGARLYEPLRAAFPRIGPEGLTRIPRGAAGAGQFISPAQSGRIRAFLERPIIRNAFRQVNEREAMAVENVAAPSFAQLQAIRKKLGRAGNRLVAQNDRAGAREFFEAHSQLTKLMEDVIPGYGAANRAYARLASVGDALKEGAKAWKNSPAEITERLAFFERTGGRRAADSYRLSMTEALIDDLRGIASNRNAARQFTDASIDFAAQLRAIMPGSEALETLLKRTELESVFFKTTQVGKNSATARRVAGMERITGGQDFLDRVTESTVTGGVGGAVATVGREVARSVSGRSKRLLPRVLSEIGQSLTLTERRAMLDLLSQLEERQLQILTSLDRQRLLGGVATGLVGREAAAPTQPDGSRIGAVLLGQ